mgnify:CR=1 FL=1
MKVRVMQIPAFVLAVLMPLGACARGADFMEGLFLEMLDPEGLARLSPNATYQLTASVDPENGGVNADRYVSSDAQGKAVLADLKGPGCVRRMFFSGAPNVSGVDFLKKPRELQFFFDGEATPRLKTTIQRLAEDIGTGSRRGPGPTRSSSPSWARPVSGITVICRYPTPSRSRSSWTPRTCADSAIRWAITASRTRPRACRLLPRKAWLPR